MLTPSSLACSDECRAGNSRLASSPPLSSAIYNRDRELWSQSGCSWQHSLRLRHDYQTNTICISKISSCLQASASLSKHKQVHAILGYWLAGIVDVHCVCIALFPSLPRFLFFGLYTRKQKSAKNGEGLGTPITWITSGGREVDVGGKGSALEYMK